MSTYTGLSNHVIGKRLCCWAILNSDIPDFAVVILTSPMSLWCATVARLHSMKIWTRGHIEQMALGWQEAMDSMFHADIAGLCKKRPKWLIMTSSVLWPSFLSVALISDQLNFPRFIYPQNMSMRCTGVVIPMVSIRRTNTWSCLTAAGSIMILIGLNTWQSWSMVAMLITQNNCSRAGYWKWLL